MFSIVSIAKLGFTNTCQIPFNSCGRACCSQYVNCSALLVILYSFSCELVTNRNHEAHPTVLLVALKENVKLSLHKASHYSIVADICIVSAFSTWDLLYFNPLRFHFMTSDRVQCILFEI